MALNLRKKSHVHYMYNQGWLSKLEYLELLNKVDMYKLTLDQLIRLWFDGSIDDEQLDYYSSRILVPYVSK